MGWKLPGEGRRTVVSGKGRKVRSSADARDQHVILGAEPTPRRNADNAVDNMRSAGYLADRESPGHVVIAMALT